MHVALLFPPVTDPRSPHLALPSLAAFLRAAGVHTSLFDVDLEAQLALLDPGAVAESARVCAARLDRTRDENERTRLRAALADAEYVVERVGAAPDRLRDPVAFFDPAAHHEARTVIARALELAAAAAGRVHYGIEPARYDVDGIEPGRLGDLLAVTGDPAANLFERYYTERLIPDLERDPPRVVGISILNSQQVIPGLALARRLKARGHFVVLGGTVYSKFVPRLLTLPEFFQHFCDGLVAYEGETALLALVEQLEGRRDLAAVPNLLHLDPRGRPRIGRLHVEDVNALPTPDFEGLPLSRYLAPAPALPILTGKGCYFNRCKFCDIPSMNRIATKAYRVRTPERIAGDVAALQARHGARHFEITDEALAPRLLLRLADALAAHPHVEARFVGYARLEPGFTAPVCRRLYEMGVRKLFFGLESGSQATLDHMDKGIRVDEAGRVLQHCADAGIAFHIFSIVGFPEETEERARDTLRFFLEHRAAIDHPRNSIDIHPFGLDLRTDYAERAASFGIEIDDAELKTYDFPLGVPRWRSVRGLDDAAVARLLAEFHATLARTYVTWRQFQGHLWPGFEEYALLYCDHYATRPFPWRFTLPAADDPLPFRLVWADSIRVERLPDGFRVRCLEGEVALAPWALDLLAQPGPPRPAGALLEALASRVAAALPGRAPVTGELRALLDALLEARVLRLEPSLEPTIAAPAGA